MYYENWFFKVNNVVYLLTKLYIKSETASRRNDGKLKECSIIICIFPLKKLPYCY